MIWVHANQSELNSDFLACVSAEMEASGADSAVGDHSLREILHAVDYYLKRDGRGDAVESRYVMMLVSKAMASLGDADAARRLLVLGTGLVRSARWDVSRGQSMWILNLRAMTVQDDMCLDIFFYTCLNIVLDATADIWDATDGVGVLGLRHVCETAEGLLGGNSHKALVQEVGRQIIDACRQRLEKIRDTRGWNGIPEIMNLDIVEQA